MDWRSTGVVTAMLTFFIMFYGNQCYNRMMGFWGHCVGLAGSTMNWTALVSNHFPDDPNQQWNAVRLFLAAMHIQYYTLNESDGGAGISEQEWNNIIGRNLLTSDEKVLITEYKGFKPFLPLVWALDEVETAFSAEDDDKTATERAQERFFHSDLLQNFRELAFAFRGHCGQITNGLAMPVPFPYFHSLTLMLVFDLLLLSYGLVTLDFEWYLTLIVYAVICLIFMGLREVAVCMADPFGDDDIDFDLEKMLKASYTNAVACLRDEHRPCGRALGNLTNPVTEANARFTVGADKIPNLAPGMVPRPKSKSNAAANPPSIEQSTSTQQVKYPAADLEMTHSVGSAKGSAKMNDSI